MKHKPAFRLMFVLFFALLSNACTTLSSNTTADWNTSSDPLEGFNRGVYAFNSKADKYVLRPVAKTYDTVLPRPAKTGVDNFFSNLWEPWNAVNNLLQGKFDRALGSTYRFIVNSTIGIGGLFDVADHYEVEEAPEDLGQTLASWGVKPGPYIVVPLLGPTTLRDGFGRGAQTGLFYPINELSDSTSVRLGLTALDAVDTRSKLLQVDSVLENQLDGYAFFKVTYDTNRYGLIMDGETVDDEEDFDF